MYCEKIMKFNFKMYFIRASTKYCKVPLNFFFSHINDCKTVDAFL